MQVSGRSLSHRPRQFQWLIALFATAERGRRGDNRGSSSRRRTERQERGAWTVPQGRTDVHAFVSSAEISEPLQLPEETGGENWRPGRNRCSYRIHTHRAGWTTRRPRFPFFGWNKDSERGSGRIAVGVNRIRYSVIYILIRTRPDISLGFNTCEGLQQHEGVMNSSTPPLPRLYYVNLLQSWIISLDGPDTTFWIHVLLLYSQVYIHCIMCFCKTFWLCGFVLYTTGPKHYDLKEPWYEPACTLSTSGMIPLLFVFRAFPHIFITAALRDKSETKTVT